MTRRDWFRNTQPLTIPPKNRPLIRHYCVNCNRMLGKIETIVEGRGPFCEVCGQHESERVFRQEEQSRHWFIEWIKRQIFGERF